jgi:hypothetical protein
VIEGCLSGGLVSCSCSCFGTLFMHVPSTGNVGGEVLALVSAFCRGTDASHSFELIDICYPMLSTSRMSMLALD